MPGAATAQAGSRTPDQVWNYQASSIESAARMHVDAFYKKSARTPPDFWCLNALSPVGKTSRLDGRQTFEARFRSERPNGPQEYRVLHFSARPLTAPDDPDLVY